MWIVKCLNKSREKIGSTAWALGPWKDFAYRDRNKRNWVVTLAIWGDVTPAAILTKCGLWGDMVDVITCAIFGDCRLRDVGVVRGVSLPSPSVTVWSWPWNVGQRSFTLIEINAIRKLGCGFLFAFYGNCDRICSRLWDIQCQKMSWPWKQVRSRSSSLKMAPFDRAYASFYWSAIVDIALSCTIFELFDVE